MTERRRHPRYAAEGMGIYAKSIFNIEVEILDVCGGGFLVRSTRRLSMGSEYTFKLENKEKAISVKGVVAREELTGSKRISEEEVMPVYTATVEFRQGLSDPDKVRQLREIIADRIKEFRALKPDEAGGERDAVEKPVSLPLKTEGRRMSKVGIKIHEADYATLSYLETCEVKDISLGGMHIETAQEPSVGTIFPLELFAGSENPIRCKGRIASCVKIPEEIRQPYRVGVEFIDMSDDDRLRLSRLIGTLS